MPAPDSTERPPSVASEELLRTADLVILGRMPWSSNATFLCELWPTGSRPDAGLTDGDDGPARGVRTSATIEQHDLSDGVPLGRAVYKPHRGERPLWDFPKGLYRREAGAYHLARAVGWDLVPPTLVREGPFGVGSVQAFVEADFEQHYFTLLEDDECHPQLRRMAAFDLVVNSTDRKGGHVLVDAEGHVWGIDNGLCLHAEFKLRTVIWDFAGEPLPAELAVDLGRFLDTDLVGELAELLDPFEQEGLRARARALLAEGRLPSDPSGRRFPWPLV
ncbi:hypothetical protein BH23ACT2_BH23ACT2_00740 [soil metagenome]